MFSKVLVANRGEIAIRVLRALRELGIRSATVYSDADRTSLHVLYADEAYHIGPPPSTESYLRAERIVEVAKKCGAEAIHPGYGFLAENVEFARLCEKEGIVFIGPTSEAIRLLGDKTEARRTMKDARIPVIPGTLEPVRSDGEAASVAREVGFPVLIKAAAGGGGKGMRVVREEKDLSSALRMAMAEASSAFGDPRVYIEKYLEKPRHIEFQVLADLHGNVVHLGERECSIQRRHQKMIEESPSIALTPEKRSEMGETARRAVKASGYTNAGTVEFLLDQQGNYYFLEVNTRLQVEHPVTELVTGIDIVKEQISIAAGNTLSFGQEDVRWRGWAIECRISAEDPARDFLPATGRVTRLELPSGPGVRVECGIYEGFEVPVYYDPLVAKLLTWGMTRDEAIARMVRALDEFKVEGIKTTIPFHREVMRHPAFLSGNYHTGFLEEFRAGNEERSLHLVAALAALVGIQEKSGEARARGPGLSPWKLAGRRESMGLL